MWKIILLIILILGCDKMATKYNTYSSTDPNPNNIIDAIDMDGKGLIRLSLTEWSTTAKPNVAQESIAENGGSRFKTDTTGGDVISLIDPTTGVTVVDGPVFIVLNGDSGSGGYGTYSFTATEPTWSDEKQGYYLTGLYSDYREVGGCQLASGAYTDKFVQAGRDNRIYYNNQQEMTEKIPTEKTITATSYADVTPSFVNTLQVLEGDIIDVCLVYESKNPSGSQILYSLVFNGSCHFECSIANPTSREDDIFAEDLRHLTSSIYRKQFYSAKIYIKSSGTLIFKEQAKVGSGTGYLKNRSIYMKKINNIKVGI